MADQGLRFKHGGKGAGGSSKVLVKSSHGGKGVKGPSQARADEASTNHNGYNIRQRSNGVERRLDVPVSSWGVIIGKGGEMLRSLQAEFHVSLSVPRPDAASGSMVTVRGTSEACDACEARVQQLVQQVSRGKAKKKPTKPRAAGVANPFPTKCPLCGAGCTSLQMAFEHLGSARHLTNMEDSLCIPLPNAKAPLSIMAVATLLTEPEVRDFHNGLGYDVDTLLVAAPCVAERQLAAIALKEEASRVTPDFNWLHVEDRSFCRWDESPDPKGNRSMLQSPHIEHMLVRCHIDEAPPLVRIPQLPSPLPKVDPSLRKANFAKGEHKWPFEPTSRLGVAVIQKRGLLLDGFDVICGTSFIKALSGDTNRTKDTFYLQRYQRTLCCLHVPQRFHSQDSAGHAVETLLCGAAGKCSSFYAASTVRIGGYRVLVTSEVDARDASGDVLELKSSSKKNGMEFVGNGVALQIALNGSQYLLGCSLDADQTQLIQTKRISASDAIQAHRAAFIGQGQRVILLLERVLNHACFKRVASSPEVGCVMQMTFDDIKAPVIVPAPMGIGVLPDGMIDEGFISPSCRLQADRDTRWCEFIHAHSKETAVL
eukprot:gnl/MRDRNA2_/MRDRNA2_120765_c0_seq1.p1 gnl/MRDRNA2_/MRDRNA2_120765_c0~~gnl/MRDRNA2_/MRDRNA2_120765_c0_seq1.p1  ORF type:complete len:621 (-),score=112.85 gnl/MRDRNA2_/MRDRNA2_120765_c0_seq1:275-2065(-)